MSEQHMSHVVRDRLDSAARHLGVASPLTDLGGLIDRSFSFAPGDAHYAQNALTPGAVPFEPSFSEAEPRVLRFSMEPIGAGPSPASRRDEATRTMRRLTLPRFGRDALRWFDERSEEWRGLSSTSRLAFGAWYGTAYDRDGLHSSKIYYELQPGQLSALSSKLRWMVREAVDTLPGLVPVFTTLSCRRDWGSQRVTFVHRGPLRVKDLEPLMRRLGLGHQLPGVMRAVGVALGGRFELPEQSVLIGIAETPEGAELKLEIMLGMLPDLPAEFVNLVALGMSERPSQMRDLSRWLQAFTPEAYDRPGDFSVLSVRTTAGSPARLALYLRPVDFEVTGIREPVPA